MGGIPLASRISNGGGLMIGDIRVYNSKGKLTKTVDGQKHYDNTFKEMIKMFDADHNVMGKTQTKTLKCPVCGVTVIDKRMGAKSCGSAPCKTRMARNKAREKRGYAQIDINCSECGVFVEDAKTNQATCSDLECKRKRRNRMNAESYKKNYWERKKREQEMDKTNKRTRVLRDGQDAIQ
jgi:hypothetical protein